MQDGKGGSVPSREAHSSHDVAVQLQTAAPFFDARQGMTENVRKIHVSQTSFSRLPEPTTTQLYNSSFMRRFLLCTYFLYAQEDVHVPSLDNCIII